MLRYSKIKKNPNKFRRFTGLTIEEFDSLYEKTEEFYPESEKKRLGRKDRKRAIGGGNQFRLEFRERLLMLFVYYRLYITFELTGFLFNLDQSNVWRNIKYLEPVVKRCIPLPAKIYNKTKKISTPEELFEMFPELKAMIDGTEQEIPRPKNKRRRKSHYSGKKKKHTVKKQVIVNKKGLIVHMTRYFPGRRHDYDIFKTTNPSIPPDIIEYYDLGYQGIEKDFPDKKVMMPRRKKKGKPRTRSDKIYNKKVSRERAIVENVIGRVKNFNVMGDKFRNRLKRYNDMSAITAGLVNFKVMMKEG